jgi:hypothetical protein
MSAGAICPRFQTGSINFRTVFALSIDVTAVGDAVIGLIGMPQNCACYGVLDQAVPYGVVLRAAPYSHNELKR